MAESEMVERVARAIFQSAYANLTWDAMTQECRDACRDEARAAIAAMREPTEAMVASGCDTGAFADGQGFSDPNAQAGWTASRVWHAMIDAVLETK